MLFSIVVPIYNIEKYLPKCIESILSQTFKDFEMILVDDGASDSCPEICDKYAGMDNRIQVLHKKNGGLVSARQEGAKISRGEYIVCVDGDDWISPYYLEKFANSIKNYNPDVVCCGSVWAYTNQSVEHPISNKEKYFSLKDIKNDIYPMLIESDNGLYFPPSLWAKAFKRKIYLEQQLQIDKNISIGEDLTCVKPIIYNASSLVLLKECLHFYRQNEESMTKKPKPFLWEGPEIISKHLEKQIPMDLFDFQEQVYRLTVHNLFNVCVSQFNKDDTYFNIKKDILLHLSLEYYNRAIDNCRYKNKLSKNYLALFCLKHKLILPLKMYNKILIRKNRS